MLDILSVSPCQKIQLTLSHICISVLVLYHHDDLFGDVVICSTVSNTFNAYHAFSFKKIKNLFMVSARSCEIYLVLQVLLYNCITLTREHKCLPGRRKSSLIQLDPAH